MFLIFEGILPIFLLVMLGVALKRAPFIDDGLWTGLEQLGYYVLFPAYLFLTLARADYGDIEIGRIGAVYLGALLIIGVLLLALWPLLKSNGVTGPQFTSIFQTTTRWNGFVALAIAERIADKPGLTMVALIIGTIIIPINFANIAVLIWFGGGKRNTRTILMRMITNPLVFASFLGIAYGASGLEIFSPLAVGLDLLARCALGMGLMIVGAGLIIRDAVALRLVTFLPVVVKLLVFPAIVVTIAMLAGIDNATIRLLALAASVPTAMNGYLLAKQLGGDANLYAAISTLQTVAAFLTIPLVLAVAAYA